MNFMVFFLPKNCQWFIAGNRSLMLLLNHFKLVQLRTSNHYFPYHIHIKLMQIKINLYTILFVTILTVAGVTIDFTTTEEITIFKETIGEIIPILALISITIKDFVLKAHLVLAIHVKSMDQQVMKPLVAMIE